MSTQLSEQLAARFGEAAVQVLHKQAVTALCNVVIEGLQDALLRHIDQQNPSFNASAFFSDYRRVMPHGGGFFQLHAPRELDDFSSVTDRYRMYLLGKEGMQDAASLARPGCGFNAAALIEAGS